MLLKQRLIFPLIFFLLAGSGCSKNAATTGLPSINTANDRVVGASANELLSTAAYTTLNVEIQYMPGFPPDPTAINNMTAFLNTFINKSGGITIHQTQIAASGKTTLSLNDVALIEKNNRTAFSSGSTIAVYILVADAAYSDPSVLGVAYRNTSVCLFGQTIQQNSGGIGQVNRTKLVTTVVEHECGHLLGLVDLGTAMVTNHKDATHGNHCNNQNCLMYYASETTDLLGFLITGNIPTLDANCVADLRANGGR